MSWGSWGSEAAGFDLNPAQFFQFDLSILRYQPKEIKEGGLFIPQKNLNKYALPSFSALMGEESFADWSVGWSTEGLAFDVLIQKPFEEAVYPEITKGDSVEIFIDTRDVKTSGFNTRFCHYFYFFAEPIEGRQKGELTHFRTEDAHPLCLPEDLVLEAELSSKSYRLKIFIPAECLVGYDPNEFNRMGFSYRVNRTKEPPQHFLTDSKEFTLEQQPSLWTSIKLV